MPRGGGKKMSENRFVVAAFNLAMGLCEVTVVLSFFGLLLFPAAYISLGVAFLRPVERLEFV
jgi:hypothetical protein